MLLQTHFDRQMPLTSTTPRSPVCLALPIMTMHLRSKLTIMGTITLPGQLAWQTQAREVSQVRHTAAQGTLASAHAFNVMKLIQLLIMTAAEKLPRAIGSRLCSHSRSRKNSIPLKWYVVPSDSISSDANKFTGDGSARVVETTHTLFLMIMHRHHGVLANIFPTIFGIGSKQ
jgi:hypothetical protein